MMIKNFNDVGDIIDDMYAEYEKEEKENEKKMAKEKEIHCDLIDGLRYILSLSTDDAIDPKYPIELIWKNSRIQLYRSKSLEGDVRDRVTFEFNPAEIKETDECILRNAPEVDPAINVTCVWKLMRENRAPLCIVSFWMDEMKNITKVDD